MDDDDFDPYLDRHDKNNWQAGVHPNPDHPTRVAARRAGKATLSAAMHSQGGRPRLVGKTPRELESVLRQLEDRGVLVFMSGRQRFSYAALGVRVGPSGDARWYITGTGQFYGKNEFTRDEFIDVLRHDEVAEIWTCVRFDQVF